MSRLMSVAMTVQAVIERRKTVTRRKGWWYDAKGGVVKPGDRLTLCRKVQGRKPGDRLTLCRKVQGRKPGEPLVRLAEVEVVSIRREMLGAVTGRTRVGSQLVDGYGAAEMILEGFPGMDPFEFIERYFTPQGIGFHDPVTRIEWRYLDTYTRPSTDAVRLPRGGKRIIVKRCCNECGRELGDANDNEMDAAYFGLSLPDVSDECGRHRA